MSHLLRLVPLCGPCLGLLLVHGVAGAAEASGVSATPAEVALSDAQIDKQLSEGAKVLQQGIPDTAITRYFDPVIRSFENAHSDPKVQAFSAHSPAESLLYLATVAQSDRAGATSAIVVSGRWVDALIAKAYAQIELEQLSGAKFTLRKAIALAPMFAAAHSELGYILQVEKDWSGAAAEYQQAETAAELMPAGPDHDSSLGRALRGQGYVLIETGRLEDAEALYQRCLKINPDDGGARNELAYISELRKRQAKPVDAN